MTTPSNETTTLSPPRPFQQHPTNRPQRPPNEAQHHRRDNTTTTTPTTPMLSGQEGTTRRKGLRDVVSWAVVQYVFLIISFPYLSLTSFFSYYNNTHHIAPITATRRQRQRRVDGIMGGYDEEKRPKKHLRTSLGLQYVFFFFLFVSLLFTDPFFLGIDTHHPSRRDNDNDIAEWTGGYDEEKSPRDGLQTTVCFYVFFSLFLHFF